MKNQHLPIIYISLILGALLLGSSDALSQAEQTMSRVQNQQQLHKASFTENVSDWFATVGKSQQEKERIRAERRLQREVMATQREMERARQETENQVQQMDRERQRIHQQIQDNRLQMDRERNKIQEQEQMRERTHVPAFEGLPGQGMPRGGR